MESLVKTPHSLDKETATFLVYIMVILSMLAALWMSWSPKDESDSGNLLNLYLELPCG